MFLPAASPSFSPFIQRRSSAVRKDSEASPGVGGAGGGSPGVGGAALGGRVLPLFLL